MKPDDQRDRRSAVALGAGGSGAASTPASSACADDPLPLEVPSLFGLDGKVAVVADSGGTGSEEVAELLANAGARVIVADRDAGWARGLAARVSARGGIMRMADVDIEDEAAVVRLFTELARTEGRLDILVNCAGLAIRRPLTETTTEIWDRLLSANLRSNFLCMREAVKLMLESRGGRIVNITTMGVLHPVLNGNAAYGASRAGVTQLGRSTALDYAAQGILVNTLLAGPIRGKVREDPETAAGPSSGPIREAGRLPLGYGSMTDIAAAVLFLVSPAARFITGQEIAVDGGFLLT